MKKINSFMFTLSIILTTIAAFGGNPPSGNCYDNEIYCGDKQVYSNENSGNSINSEDFPCIPGSDQFYGNDVIVEFYRSSSIVENWVTIWNYGDDIDLFVFDDCPLTNPNANCVGVSTNSLYNNDLNYEKILLSGLSSGYYYILIDAQYPTTKSDDINLSVSCEGLNCTNAQPLDCGVNDGDNRGLYNSTANYYGCYNGQFQGSFTGGEEIWEFTAPESGNYTFVLDPPNGIDLELFLLNECCEGEDDGGGVYVVTDVDECYNNNNCEAGSTNPAGYNETITKYLYAGESVFLIVDGWLGDESEYTLTVNCGGFSCNEISDLNCNDLISDYNDTYYSNQATDVIDDHPTGNIWDGFYYDNLNSNTKFKNHELIYRTNIDPFGYSNLTIDLKPVNYDLNVDLFVYEYCNDQTTFALENCLFRSTESNGLNDAVFIENANDEYYAVVDGQSGVSGYTTEGQFEIIMTCGKLSDHVINPIACGSTNGNTDDEQNFASYYSCDDTDFKAGNYGPEKVYSFEHEGGSLKITLEILENNADLNLYLLGDIYGEPTVIDCKNKSKTEETGYGSIEEIDIQNLSAGIYYIVVEGYSGDAGKFKLDIDCGKQKKCTDCSYCFSYWNNGRDFHFINNYCNEDGGYIGLRENETYEWTIPADAIDYFMNNSTAQSPEPEIKFLPGTWEICLKITIPYNGNPIIYECCMIIIVPNGGCNNRPPVCGLNYQQNNDNTFTFDASNSSEVDFYSWSIAGADDGKTYYTDQSDTSIVNLNLQQFGHRCYIVTVYGNNCYGFSKYSVKICISDDNCKKVTPPGCDLVNPVTNNEQLTFNGVPNGWDIYEWNVPDEFELISGNNNSQTPIYRIPPTGTYTVCLILRSGCSHICLCWTVKRGCCPVQSCDDNREVYCNDVINDNNKGTNNYTTDIINKYDDNNCIEFKTGNGQVYHPSFKSKEVRYKYHDIGFSRPVTVDVKLRESDPKFDLDVFLFKDCQYNRPVNCVDSSGHLPPGLNESVYLTSDDMSHIDDLHIFVDGQSFSYPYYRLNEGNYTLAITCGPLSGLLGDDPQIIPIGCGQTFSNNNNTGKNFGSWYSCDPETNRGNNWGKENIYSFTINQNKEVSINLDILDNVDLSLYLLDDVDVKSCIATGKTKGKRVDEAIIKTLQPGTYYIIVDGFAGDEGRYKLSLNCSEGTTLTFDIDDDICGSKNSIVDVPIRVKNFTDVATYEFSVNVNNTSIAEIVDVIGNGIQKNIINNGKVYVSWFSTTGYPVTLADNSIIATIKVKLVGNIGQSTTLTFKDENAENAQGTIPLIAIKGSVCISDDIGKICGIITREDNVGIDSVIVKLIGVNKNETTMTNSNGEYCFEDVPTGEYSITPTKDINHLNGVTGGDLFSIQRHLLQKHQLNSPYKIISGDANTSKKITGGDLFQIQRLILRKDEKFKYSESWKFVDKSYSFPDNKNPFKEDFPQEVTINHSATDDLGIDFIGTKIGDVNLTNNPLKLISPRSSSEIRISVESKDVAEKEEITIPITVDEFKNIGALQFSLNWDNSLLSFKELVLTNSAISLSENNFNAESTNIGQLAMSWYDTNGSGVTLTDNLELFALKFNVIGSIYQTAFIDITDSPISISAENLDGEMTVHKNNGIIKITSWPNAVIDNNISQDIIIYPNPFNQGINISLSERIESSLKIKVYEINGKLISITNAKVNKEANKINLDEDHFNGSGIYILEISSDKFVVTKKVVKI